MESIWHPFILTLQLDHTKTQCTMSSYKMHICFLLFVSVISKKFCLYVPNLLNLIISVKWSQIMYFYCCFAKVGNLAIHTPFILTTAFFIFFVVVLSRALSKDLGEMTRSHPISWNADASVIQLFTQSLRCHLVSVCNAKAFLAQRLSYHVVNIVKWVQSG